MTGFLGMNADEVEKLGNQIQNQVTSEIDAVIAKMNGLVGRLPEIWQGADSQRFVNDWPAHRTNLTHIVNELKTFGASAVKEAVQQRAASN